MVYIISLTGWESLGDKPLGMSLSGFSRLSTGIPLLPGCKCNLTSCLKLLLPWLPHHGGPYSQTMIQNNAFICLCQVFCCNKASCQSKNLGFKQFYQRMPKLTHLFTFFWSLHRMNLSIRKLHSTPGDKTVLSGGQGWSGSQRTGWVSWKMSCGVLIQVLIATAFHSHPFSFPHYSTWTDEKSYLCAFAHSMGGMVRDIGSS